MTEAYLLVYDGQVGDREKLKNALNSMSTVTTWRYDLPNAFYVISDRSAREIADELKRIAGPSGKFIVSEIPKNSYGWLTSDSWYLIQNLRHKPKQT